MSFFDSQYGSSNSKNRYTAIPTDKQKESNNFQLAKEYIDMYDDSCPLDTKKIERYQENWELHSGRWGNIENMSPNVKIELGNELVELGAGTLKHYGVIDRVSRNVYGDLILRPLIPIIKDYSSKARNSREIARLGRVKEFFQSTVITPKVQQLQHEWYLKNNIIDPLSMPEEAIRQMDFEVQQSLRQQTPEEIFDYMEKFNTPDELIAHALLKHTINIQNVKTKFDDGGESAIVTGSEFYKLTILGKIPQIQVLNSKYVEWIPSSINPDIVEDGIMAKYKQFLRPEELIGLYGKDLKFSDMKKLAKDFSMIPGADLDIHQWDREKRMKNGIETNIVEHLADNPQMHSEMDVRTRDGQEKYKALIQSLGNSQSIKEGGIGVADSYVTWRWGRRAKLVTREVNGAMDFTIRGGHYEKNSAFGDIEVKDIVVDQTWEGNKVADEYYFNVRPRPLQYNNINSPFKPKLGIFGGEDNTFRGNARNASFIDLGKPFQYKYNVIMKRMEDHQATDIGSVLLGTTSMIPKDWTWGQWYKSLFVGRTALVDVNKDGMSNMDLSSFRTLDLSRQKDIAADIQLLEYIENKIFTSMYFSKEKVGQISPYSTNQNIQQSISGVDRQMLRFHNKRRLVKERVLNQLMHLSLIAYKDNEDIKSTVLDDFQKVYYEQNYRDIITSNFYLGVVDDFAESEKLKQMQDLALTLLQNGLSGRELSGIMKSESIPEVDEILVAGDKRREKVQKEQQQNLENIEKSRAESAKAQLELQQAFISSEAERDRQVKLALGELNSIQLERANDVNDNKINDSLEKAKLEIEQRDRSDDKKLKAAMAKLNSPSSKNT